MKILLILVTSMLLEAQMVQRVQLMMGTLVSIKIDAKENAKIEGVFNEIKAVENSLSSFKKSSIISRLNKNKKVALDALSFEALTLCKDYYKQTDGYFNIAIGVITKDLYSFGEDEHLATAVALSASDVSFNALVFNAKIAKISDTIKIDLGGMGKGFAIDKVRGYLKEQGVEQAIVSASGDIRCLSRCSISVENPFGEGVSISFKTMKQDLGITTSGNYHRFVQDKKHNHLINPKTKRSQENFSSITLVGSMSSSALDAYATAVSVMPKDKAYAFLDALDLAYFVVEVNGKSLLSPAGFFELQSTSR